MVWEKLATNAKYDIEKIDNKHGGSDLSNVLPHVLPSRGQWKIADFWIAASQHPKNDISRFCRLALHAMYSCYKP